MMEKNYPYLKRINDSIRCITEYVLCILLLEVFLFSFLFLTFARLLKKLSCQEKLSSKSYDIELNVSKCYFFCF